MKASVRFPESNNTTTTGTPLLRLKIPVQILGLPFISGLSVGDASTSATAATSSTSLRFDLATAFHSFPSLRLSYRLTDAYHPFALVVKSGIGNFGSPVSSPMTMTAEFGLSGNRNPNFLIKFSPQIGDFCLKKVVREETMGKEGFSMEVWSPRKVVDRVLSGTEVIARSVMPVKKVGDVKVRWGVRVPSEISNVKLPHLVINKVSIEYDSQKKNEVTVEENDHRDGSRKQLEVLRKDNRSLRCAVEELRKEFTRKKAVPEAVLPGNPAGRNGAVDEKRKVAGENESRNSGKGSTPTAATSRNGRRSDGKGSTGKDVGAGAGAGA